MKKNAPRSDSFYGLSPERVLDSVESAMQETQPGIRATGRVLALNSLENRVYQIDFEDGSEVVAKFYRPHRWNENQLAEEHFFLERLQSAEVPVVSPLKLSKKKARDYQITKIPSLGMNDDGIWFTVFPRVRGRLVDELSETQIQTLARYVARIHLVGKDNPLQYRLRLNVSDWGEKPAEKILKSKFMDANFRSHYQATVQDFLELARPRLARLKMQAIHGDCHLGNTLWQNDSPFFIDFDDLMIGPAVQDIWMIFRGRDEETIKQRDFFLNSYRQFADFDSADLRMVEALRGLRMIHYSAWIADRWEDPAFPNAFNDFGSPSYWRTELEALRESSEILRSQGTSDVEPAFQYYDDEFK